MTAAVGEHTRVLRAVEDLRARIGELGLDDPKDIWGAIFDAGLSRVDFPEGLGGLGLQPEVQLFAHDALVDAGIGEAFAENLTGILLAAPIIATFGSRAQQECHLRRIFTCEEIWCQLFSEPDAGSDLAALRTRAVRDGDVWRVDGRKVWNTMAHVSDYGLLLARTSDASRHRGITCFLVDLHQEGVEVRPIRQMTGDAEFNEVVFDDAVIPDSARVGEVDRGWSVALGTLMAERFAVIRVLENETPYVDEIVELWRRLPSTARTTARRDELMRLVVRSRVLDLMRIRFDGDVRNGLPGPEGSLAKLMQAELTPAVFDFGVDLLGPEGMLVDGYEVPRLTSWSEAGVKPGNIQRAFLRSRAYRIEGGTVEIQRNTIAERILGLPRSVRPDQVPS